MDDTARCKNGIVGGEITGAIIRDPELGGPIGCTYPGCEAFLEEVSDQHVSGGSEPQGPNDVTILRLVGVCQKRLGERLA